MNKLIILSLTVFMVLSASAQINNETPVLQNEPPKILKLESAPNAKIKWDTIVHDFGQVKEGEKATYTFEFTNVGTTPLTIKKVNASCGCTTPSWSKEAIAPGNKGFVTAVFDSNHKVGKFAKSLTVIHNAVTLSTFLVIKGTVLPKKPTISNKN